MALTTVNSDGVKDDSIKNIDVKSDAAIAGTKISPDFGSQNIVTTGTATVNQIVANSTDIHQIKRDAGSANNNAYIAYLIDSHTTGSPMDGFGTGIQAKVNGVEKGRLQFLNNSDLKISTGSNSVALTIDSDQNVGIGTENPTELLSLSKAITTEATLLSLTGTSFGDEEKVFMAFKRGTEELGKIGVEADGAGQSGHLVFETTTSGTSSEKVRISNSGKVGISTENPSAPLHIVGSDNTTTLLVESTDADANVGPIIELFRNSSSPADNDAIGRIDFKCDDDAGNASTFARIAVTALDVSNGSEDARIDFTAATNDTFTPTMSISGGKVGITNDAPLYEMHFKNAMSSSPSWIHMEVTGGSDANTVGGGGGIAFDTSASNSASNNGLYLATIAGIRNSDDDGSNDLVFSTTRNTVNNNLPLEKVRINAHGRVLIGHSSARIVGSTTVNPYFQLEGTDYNASLSVVRNSANAHPPYLVLGKSRSASVGGYNALQDNDVLASIRFAGADGVDMAQYGAEISVQVDGTPGADSMPSEMIFRTNTGSGNPTEKLRITKQGIVSINDSTPESFAALQINNHTTSSAAQILLRGADMAQIIMRDDTGGTNTKCTTIRNDEGDFLVGTHNDAYSSWQEKFHIDSSGNVSIGGIAPVPTDPAYNKALLHIHQTQSGTYGSELHLTNNTTGSTATDGMFLSMWTDNDVYFTNQESGDINFTTNGHEAFKIQSNKNVKITDGNLIFDTGGHGIDFSAQTSTSASGAQVSGAGHEILNHYEEGQWTPTPSGTGQSYSWRKGRYTRIGNTVFYWFDVSWTGMTGSMTDGSITGLPFTSTALTTQAGYGAVSLRSMTGLESDIRVYGNSTYVANAYLQLQHFNSSGTVDLTDFLASGRVTGEGFYYVNNAY